MIPLLTAIVIASAQLTVAILAFITSRANAKHLAQLEVSVDGRLKQLLEETSRRSFVEGEAAASVAAKEGSK